MSAAAAAARFRQIVWRSTLDLAAAAVQPDAPCLALGPVWMCRTRLRGLCCRGHKGVPSSAENLVRFRKPVNGL